jgi:predicted transcriptional regulator
MSKGKRTKINEELIIKWVKRFEDGASYSKIAQESSSNSATVSKYIKAARDAGPKKRYEAALISIESENLRIHNRSMVMTAEAIAQCVMVDPQHDKLVGQEDWRFLFNHYLEQQLLANNDWLIERGTHFGSESGRFDSSWAPDPSITFDIAREEPAQRRLSQLLLSALYEHDQNLKKEVDKWADKWKKFKKKQANKIARDAEEKTREAHGDLKKAAVFIRDLVDNMTLYGRPSGDCFLCRASGS